MSLFVLCYGNFNYAIPAHTGLESYQDAPSIPAAAFVQSVKSFAQQYINEAGLETQQQDEVETLKTVNTLIDRIADDSVIIQKDVVSSIKNDIKQARDSYTTDDKENDVVIVIGDDAITSNEDRELVYTLRDEGINIVTDDNLSNIYEETSPEALVWEE